VIQAGAIGGAVGAALAARDLRLGRPRTLDCDVMRASYLGLKFAQSEIDKRPSASSALFDTLSEQE
jgi:hypothetical protein